MALLLKSKHYFYPPIKEFIWKAKKSLSWVRDQRIYFQNRVVYELFRIGLFRKEILAKKLYYYFKRRSESDWNSVDAGKVKFIKSIDQSEFPMCGFEGWSFHPNRFSPWTAIIACLEDKVIGFTAERILRPDVFAHYQQKCPRNTGFNLLLNLSALKKIGSVRFYSLYESGEAIELQVGPAIKTLFVKDELKQPGEQIHWQNKIYRISADVSHGFLDRLYLPVDLVDDKFFERQVEELTLHLNSENVGSGIEILLIAMITALKAGFKDRVEVLWGLYQKYNFSTRYVELLNVLSIEKASKQNKIKIHELFPAHQFQFQMPEVYPNRGGPLRVWKSLPVPAECVFEVENASIHFGSIVTQEKNYLVLDPTANPNFDFVAGIHPYLFGSEKLTELCFVVGEQVRQVELDQGILLDGRCPKNYFHWMIEYLPRLASIEALNHLKSVPLIVNADMPTSMKESIQLLAPEREIYWNHPKDQLKVRRLYVPSLPTFQPDTLKVPLSEGATLSKRQLLWIRDRVMSQLGKLPPLQGRKIMIARKGGLARGILNQGEIIRFFSSRGFEIVDPGELTFLEQVKLFASASVIAGCTGAAFANILFCQPGAQIISFVMEDNSDFLIQSNLAQLVNANYLFVTGPSEEPRMSYNSPYAYLHSNFWVPLSHLKKALQRLRL